MLLGVTWVAVLAVCLAAILLAQVGQTRQLES
jgi:hypothetical protein